MTLLKENNLRSIAFPCISTGIYGYPQVFIVLIMTMIMIMLVMTIDAFTGILCTK